MAEFFKVSYNGVMMIRCVLIMAKIKRRLGSLIKRIRQNCLYLV